LTGFEREGDGPAIPFGVNRLRMSILASEFQIFQQVCDSHGSILSLFITLPGSSPGKTAT
jgi:hypothetical protein